MQKDLEVLGRIGAFLIAYKSHDPRPEYRKRFDDSWILQIVCIVCLIILCINSPNHAILIAIFSVVVAIVHVVVAYFEREIDRPYECFCWGNLYARDRLVRLSSEASKEMQGRLSEALRQFDSKVRTYSGFTDYALFFMLLAYCLRILTGSLPLFTGMLCGLVLVDAFFDISVYCCWSQLRTEIRRMGGAVLYVVGEILPVLFA